MQATHPIIQPFLDYLKFEKRYSKHTIISYETDLISFFDYLITQYGEMPVGQVSHIFCPQLACRPERPRGEFKNHQQENFHAQVIFQVSFEIRRDHNFANGKDH